MLDGLYGAAAAALSPSLSDALLMEARASSKRQGLVLSSSSANIGASTEEAFPSLTTRHKCINTSWPLQLLYLIMTTGAPALNCSSNTTGT
jgi:hypothetical protein